MNLQWVTGLFVICGSLWCSAEIHYREPAFDAKLFEQSDLILPQEQRIELAWALTSLTRNFPEDSTISPRAKAMALLLSHHFLPLDRDTVIANFHLRHGLETRPTGHFDTKEAAITRIEAVRDQAKPNGADATLKLLLQDLLNEVLGEERAEEKRWQGVVAPAPRKLVRKDASLRFITSSGTLASCGAHAEPLNKEGRFRVLLKEQELTLPPEQLDRLAVRYPYASQHLQISLVLPSQIPLSSRRRELFVDILVDQLLNGWVWPQDVALCGVSEGVSDASVISRLDAFHRKTPDSGLTALLVPPLPAVAFRDWMAFDRLHQLVQVALISASSSADVLAWQEQASEREEVEKLYDQCRLILRKRVASPAQLSKNPRLMALLGSVADGYSRHLSTQILRVYASFERAPRGTLNASLAWIDDLLVKVTPRSMQQYNRQFREQTCRQVLASLRLGHRRVAPKARALIGDLERYIEQHAIPFSRVTAKQTKTARRQFEKLNRARGDFRAALQKLKRGL